MKLISSNRRTICVCALVAASAVSFRAQAQTQVNSQSVNGVLNPTFFAGSDIGARINTAWESGHTVRVPASSTPYVFTTSIQHPGASYTLQCDAGAILNYQGSGDAIVLPSTSGTSTEGAGIDGEGGCEIEGTSKGSSGIHVHTSDHTSIRNLRITGFSNGSGIIDSGGISLGISGVSIYANLTGILLEGESGGQAASAVRIYDSNISNNYGWGISSQNVHCCGPNSSNLILGNVIETNKVGGVELKYDQGTTVEHNYFESNATHLAIGDGSDNVFGVVALGNYFTVVSNPSIALGYGIGFHFEDNTDVGGSPTCLINEVTGGAGGLSGVRGLGTNYPESDESEFCKHGVATKSP